MELSCKNVTNKVASAVDALSKLKNLLPTHTKLILYNSLFRSHAEFGLCSWSSSKSKDIERICVLQKRAVKYMDNAKYSDHTGPIFKKHNILKFQNLVNLHQGCFYV